MPTTSDSKKGKPSKQSGPSVFEHQLSQFETDLKSAHDDGDTVMVKELSRYIRNLKAIIQRVKGMKNE